MAGAAHQISQMRCKRLSLGGGPTCSKRNSAAAPRHDPPRASNEAEAAVRRSNPASDRGASIRGFCGGRNVHTPWHSNSQPPGASDDSAPSDARPSDAHWTCWHTPTAWSHKHELHAALSCARCQQHPHAVCMKNRAATAAENARSMKTRNLFQTFRSTLLTVLAGRSIVLWKKV